MNGFGRVIHYYDATGAGKQPSTAFQIWEGRLRDGKPHGFSRFVSATSDYAFLGYLRNWFTTLNGTGLFFKEEQLAHSGVYGDAAKLEDDPQTTLQVTQFERFS